MAVRTWRRGSVAVAGALGVVLALAACGGSSGSKASSTSSGTAGGGASAGCEAFAKYGTFPSGTTVNIFASIRDVEADRFVESFKTFEKCTGITIKWEGSGEFETQLVVRVDGGNAPDLAPIPQPGLLQTMVKKNAVKAASDAVKKQSVEAYSPDWLKYGTINGTFYAPPLGANVKSFVWYSPKMFKENNWQIPTTMADMNKLTETIIASKKIDKPWCAGIESGDATGWPATDWLEDFVLRTSGPEVYDQWVAHTIPFNAPPIVAALDDVGTYLKNPARVNGGYGDVKSIATTSFQEAGLPILDGDCALMRQASFYANQWPKGTTVAEDGDVFAFYLPAKDTTSKPVLGGGEFLAAFNDKKETQAVQLYMGSAEWTNEKAKLGDWISPSKFLETKNVVSPDGQPNPINVLSVQILQDKASVFRFDGSDMMPSAVGAGTFWKGMTAWITGKSTKEVLDAIEASWPKTS